MSFNASQAAFFLESAIKDLWGMFSTSSYSVYTPRQDIIVRVKGSIKSTSTLLQGKQFEINERIIMLII
jgi:hypothetical protein